MINRTSYRDQLLNKSKLVPFKMSSKPLNFKTVAYHKKVQIELLSDKGKILSGKSRLWLIIGLVILVMVGQLKQG